jgi:hypothetical protein
MRAPWPKRISVFPEDLPIGEDGDLPARFDESAITTRAPLVVAIDGSGANRHHPRTKRPAHALEEPTAWGAMPTALWQAVGSERVGKRRDP